MNLKFRLFSPEKFIILLIMMMIAIRVGYLQLYDAVNEVKFGNFDLQDHFVNQFHYYFFAILYVVLQIKLCVDFSYSKVSRTTRNNSFIYFVVFIFFAIKFLNPAQYYVDFFIPIYFLLFIAMSKDLSSGNKAKLFFLIVLILLLGVVNGSKASALRLLLVLPLIFLLQHKYHKLKIKLSIRNILILCIIFYITIYMVSLRTGFQFSFNLINQLIALAIDITTQRFNIIDGSMAMSWIEGIDISYSSYVMNHFVLLPGINPSGQTLANFVACNVDLNCSGSHAGAIGLPMILKSLPAYYIITSLIFTTLLYYVTRTMISYLNLGIHWFIAFDVVFLITVLNIFISGNLDVCVSEYMVLCISILGFAIFYLFTKQLLFGFINAK